MTVIDARSASPRRPTERDPSTGTSRGADHSGRTLKRCISTVSRGELIWIHTRQTHPNGTLIFEFATQFVLNGMPIDERLGERLLDHGDLRIDGTHRSS